MRIFGSVELPNVNFVKIITVFSFRLSTNLKIIQILKEDMAMNIIKKQSRIFHAAFIIIISSVLLLVAGCGDGDEEPEVRESA